MRPLPSELRAAVCALALLRRSGGAAAAALGACEELVWVVSRRRRRRHRRGDADLLARLTGHRSGDYPERWPRQDHARFCLSREPLAPRPTVSVGIAPPESHAYCFPSHLIVDLELDAATTSKLAGHANPNVTMRVCADDFRKATDRNAAVLARAAERGFGTGPGT